MTDDNCVIFLMYCDNCEYYDTNDNYCIKQKLRKNKNEYCKHYKVDKNIEVLPNTKMLRVGEFLGKYNKLIREW